MIFPLLPDRPRKEHIQDTGHTGLSGLTGMSGTCTMDRSRMAQLLIHLMAAVAMEMVCWVRGGGVEE